MQYQLQYSLWLEIYPLFHDTLWRKYLVHIFKLNAVSLTGESSLNFLLPISPVPRTTRRFLEVIS